MKIKFLELGIDWLARYESGSKELRLVLQRAEVDVEEIEDKVRRIIAEVKEQGDSALIEHLAKFDKVNISANQLEATPEDFDNANTQLDEPIKSAIDHAIVNITKFHKKLQPKTVPLFEIEPGVYGGEKVTPIEKVGLYVPRGKGAFPSVMCMLGVPAVLAGVNEIVVCTPPTAEGGIDSATLYSANKIGIKNIYKIGGASAIASLAYGTQTIPKVHKIIGPGNSYCVAAKRLLTHTVDVGLPAGPSESIILSDGSISLQKILLDLCIEAEHGPDSSALLVTHDKKLAESVREKLPVVIDNLPEPRKNFCQKVFSEDGYGGIILTNSLEDSITFTNLYAPEHLEILIRNNGKAMEVMEKIKNAGEILIGEHTPISLGNYCLGVNAILPTGSRALTHSCTSIESFVKRTSIAHCTKPGYNRLKKTALILAEFEGFPAHAKALTDRD